MNYSLFRSITFKTVTFHHPIYVVKILLTFGISEEKLKKMFEFCPVSVYMYNML